MSNLQYKRTHRNITNAFITLLQKKPFEKITVKHILEEALVHRSTFYKHFKDKYDIAEELQTFYLEELIRAINTIEKIKLDEICKMMNTYFIANRTVLKSLIKIRTEQTNIILEWKRIFEEIYTKATDSPNVALEAKVFSAIIVEFSNYYIEDDNISPDSSLFFDTFRNTAITIMALQDDTELRESNIRKMEKNVLKKY